MTGTVELAPDGQHLLIRFPYREDLVATVKALPGRRWDPKNKVWSVPAAHVEAVYAALAQHLFEFASEIPSLLAGTLRAPTPAEAPTKPKERLGPARQAALPMAMPAPAPSRDDLPPWEPRRATPPPRTRCRSAN